MGHIKNVFDSLTHYVDLLEWTGEYDKDDTAALLVYVFIVDAIFNGPLQYYAEDKDLSVLNKVIACLSKQNCAIPRIPSGQRASKPKLYYNPAVFRMTQDYFPRKADDDNMRITESDI